MIETRKARLFKNGGSQAVRLPAKFRFKCEEIFITRDDASGDLVLSTRPGTAAWREFFELLHLVDVPDDFLLKRPLNEASAEHGIFDGEAGH